MHDSPRVDADRLRDWIGRAESSSDEVTIAPMIALAATLDRDDPPPRRGDPLPLLWHWLYFLPRHRQSELGPDGHAQLGGFLPPVGLPRRMYAGGRIARLLPLRVGDTISRTSEIVDVASKAGRTGPLVFVKVRHYISNAAGRAVIEDQDIVYRDNPSSHAGATTIKQAPADEMWRRKITPDAVRLFRYSALTFNGHRIHYDRAFAEEQGYPGLVVHGPLIATLLAELLRRHQPDVDIATFSFRAVKPLFDTEPFLVCGRMDGEGGERTAKLWAQGMDGALAVDAAASFRT